ncbi:MULTISPECIES: NUDIX hydrolase [Brachyspira]|uniref:NUDIX hydrolase n=2 Tax=Brachyspira TaxID=29521 RepID=A0AAC9XKH4_9SPIR|nr:MULTISPECIES: NUDIX domain-containing protein [Brachyspira]ADG71826.1 NUDIX hydrolase [Brachyspira murdochii DSM 12563]ASJ21268.1 NUDIX hydrolase [Brachyspira hampsonii]ELV06302.1 NUDIX hydrolase [Brachyspira hampsonii 30599]MBW5379578.1 NUDIX domain-containing protein [Brachyspira hampsonii]OEJ18683.1 NUDIX hydrolase [Brachyspira hampsonii]
MTEIWDVYNRNKQKTGRIHQRGLPLRKNEYHIVIHAWVVNSNDEVIMTKRHKSKKICPNKWECTEGSILTGESSIEGAIREIKEEIGLSFEKEEGIFLTSFILERSKTIIDAFMFRRDVKLENLILQENEVSEAMIVDREKYFEMCKNKKIVSSIRYFYDIYDKLK